MLNVKINEKEYQFENYADFINYVWENGGKFENIFGEGRGLYDMSMAIQYYIQLDIGTDTDFEFPAKFTEAEAKDIAEWLLLKNEDYTLTITEK